MSGKKRSDMETLWDAFLKGDDKAFAGIYYSFVNPLLSYGKKLTHDHEMLHDAIQEIFMDLYLKRTKHHTPVYNTKAYLFIALRNSIIKKLLHKRKSELKDQDYNMFGEFNVEYSFQDQLITREVSEEKRNRLQQAIVSLSPGQKEIIYLKFEEDLGYREIAELMSITVESARKQLYRALLSLRQILGSQSFYTFLAFFLKNNSKRCPC